MDILRMLSVIRRQPKQGYYIISLLGKMTFLRIRTIQWIHGVVRSMTLEMFTTGEHVDHSTLTGMGLPNWHC